MWPVVGRAVCVGPHHSPRGLTPLTGMQVNPSSSPLLQVLGCILVTLNAVWLPTSFAGMINDTLSLFSVASMVALAISLQSRYTHYCITFSLTPKLFLLCIMSPTELTFPPEAAGIDQVLNGRKGTMAQSTPSNASCLCS